MDVTHDTAGHRFLIRTETGEAVLEYTADENPIVFTHTFVPPALRGQGIAEKLVRTGLAWARETGRPITATCSYVARFLERNSPGKN